MQQQQQQQSQQSSTQPLTQQPSVAAATPTPFSAVPGSNPMMTFGMAQAPQMPQSNMLASMASMPPAFQMLIAQNAAWLFSQAQSQGVVGGAGVTFPGIGLTGADGTQFAPAGAAAGGVPAYGGYGNDTASELQLGAQVCSCYKCCACCVLPQNTR